MHIWPDASWQEDLESGPLKDETMSFTQRSWQKGSQGGGKSSRHSGQSKWTECEPETRMEVDEVS